MACHKLYTDYHAVHTGQNIKTFILLMPLVYVVPKIPHYLENTLAEVAQYRRGIT